MRTTVARTTVVRTIGVRTTGMRATDVRTVLVPAMEITNYDHGNTTNRKQQWMTNTYLGKLCSG